METEANYKYYVVEFLDPPYQPFNRYVCVPDSWITYREIHDQVVAVRYPIEKTGNTKKRVKKKQKFSDNWTIFVAYVKYGTDSYKDAKRYIKVLDNRIAQERSYQESESEGNKPSTSGYKLRYPVVGKSTIIKFEAPSNYDPQPETYNTISNQTKLAHSSSETQYIKANACNTTETAKKETRYFTRQAYRSSQFLKDEQWLETGATSDESTEMTNNSIVDDKKQPPEQHYPDTPELLTKEVPINKLCRHSIFDSDFTDILREMYTCLEKNHLMYDYMRHKYLQRCSDLKNLINLVERYNKEQGLNERIEFKKVGNVTRGNIVVKKVKEQIETLTKKRKNTKDLKDNDDSNVFSDSSKPNSVLRTFGQAHSFTLPPDYDANDSRWTLKYREKRKGLIELLPHSGVYVNTCRLRYCKMLSKDSKTFARLLLSEVFRKSALRTCSLTGKKAHAFDFKGNYNVRPGLDENARTVMIQFVKQHALAKNWKKIDTQSIHKALRSKMQFFRYRCP